MNIEKTISEQAVSDILTPMLESQDRIVIEDVAPLFDQATGLDTPPASGTVTTTIEESRNLITAIIRKAWTATLTMLGGASVISYIAAAYTYLRNRLQGNETYGIPDRRSEISASSPLAANLALLNDRKISNGGAENDGIVDGVSMAHILGDSTLGITKLIDDNYGWVCNKALPSIGTLSEATLNMVGITAANALRNTGATILRLPQLKTITSGTSQYNDPMPAASEEIYLPELTESHCIFCQADFRAKKIVAPKLRTLSGRCFYDWSIANEPLVELRLPELRNIPEGFLLCWTGDTSRKPWVNLILFEIGSDVSLNISAWNPTNALSSSASDLVADPTAHPTWKNLDQFLQNFKEHIALRLTDNGSGKTLTLSQAVRNAIHAAESTYGIENIIITQKGWTISPAPN